MTREEILNTALQIKSNNICLNLATGTGKTYIALKLIQEKVKGLLVYDILIVVPKNVLKDEWIKEIKKWNMEELIPHITFSTYVSLSKYACNPFTVRIFDEAHHLTERCIDALSLSSYKDLQNILLSATIKRSQWILIRKVFPNIYTLKVDIKDAINNNILPDPEVLLIPLRLDKINQKQIYIKRKSAKKIVRCYYKDRWKYLRDKSLQVQIYCSECEYYELLEGDYVTATNQCREIWKRQLAIQRLKWLSEIKTSFMLNLLKLLKNERTLTFCHSIEQCEKLGSYPIHSGDKQLIENLKKFNNGEINHITSCNILQEGANITNLNVGIFANINSSSLAIAQKTGRLLRHEKPVIIIPYYEGTREEEIVKDKILEQFNQEKIHIINYLNEIKSYLK